MIFFLSLLAPSFLPLSDQVCWAKTITTIGEQNIALVSHISMFLVCPTCSQCGKQAATDHTIPSCPYTTSAVHLAGHIWVPTKAIPSHRRLLQWFLWVGPADKHSIHHHRRAHQSPLCPPRHPSKLSNRRYPGSQRSLMTTNFTRKWANRVQPHKSTPYPQCLAFGTFFFFFLVLSYHYWTMSHINLSLTSEALFVYICICVYIYIFLLTRGDVMSPLRYSHMIASHSKVPVSTRAWGWE